MGADVAGARLHGTPSVHSLESSGEGFPMQPLPIANPSKVKRSSPFGSMPRYCAVKLFYKKANSPGADAFARRAAEEALAW